MLFFFFGFVAQIEYPLHFRAAEVFTSKLGWFQKVVISLCLNMNYIPPCEVYSLFVF